MHACHAVTPVGSRIYGIDMAGTNLLNMYVLEVSGSYACLLAKVLGEPNRRAGLLGQVIVRGRSALDVFGLVYTLALDILFHLCDEALQQLLVSVPRG